MKNIISTILLLYAGCAFSAVTPPRVGNFFTTNLAPETLPWTNSSADGIRAGKITVTNLNVSQYGTNYVNNIAPAYHNTIGLYGGINHGLSNRAPGPYSAAIGGRFNEAYGVIIGGIENTNDNTVDSVIIAGNVNAIGGGDNNSVVLGGSYNTLSSGSDNSVIIGGIANSNYAGDQSVIIGGSSNYMTTSANGNSTIIGGFFNTVVVGGSGILVGYGLTNTANNQVVVGYGTHNIRFDSSGAKISGLPAISFILTNGITGIQTNYTYFTNGLAFTNIAYPNWVLWP